MPLLEALLNIDHDLLNEIANDVDPAGNLFRSLPLAEQLKQLLPYLDEQQRRDHKRLRSVRGTDKRAA